MDEKYIRFVKMQLYLSKDKLKNQRDLQNLTSISNYYSSRNVSSVDTFRY